MTAVRAQVDQETHRSSRRTTTRRKLRLEAPGSIASDGDVLILDISTTGLLIKASGDLVVGETVEFDLPEACGTRAVVKWSNGQLFGCQFRAPVSVATVSAALLRAPSAPRQSPALAPPRAKHLAGDPRHADDEQKLPLTVRLRWIAGLTLVSWGIVATPVLLAWLYI